MSIGISLIVLFAAVLHASWNALLRGGGDRLWSMTIMCIAIALACGLMVPFVPVPAAASWGCVALSALLHTGYNLFLVRTYRQGDLGQTYPIARGASPLLVALGAAVFARELPDAVSLAGVLLMSGGIATLAFQGRAIGQQALLFALGTGCFIGAYSVTDDRAVRRQDQLRFAMDMVGHFGGMVGEVEPVGDSCRVRRVRVENGSGEARSGHHVGSL